MMLIRRAGKKEKFIEKPETGGKGFWAFFFFATLREASGVFFLDWAAGLKFGNRFFFSPRFHTFC